MKINNIKELIRILKIDSKKYGSRCILKSLVKDPRFSINFWLRLGCYLNNKVFYGKSILLRLIKNRLAVKYGFDTTFNVHIEEGLRVVHLGGIVIHGNCVIGKNLTILNNVTLGQSQRISPYDVPSLGGSVYIGVNSVLIGNISVGSNVTIGAFSLVNKSINSNCTVVGIPFKILKVSTGEK
jgi:serine O-acetyltransferase